VPPVTIARGICYDPDGWTGTDVFYVKERFQFFPHWTVIHFQPDLVMNEPSNPGGRGAGARQVSHLPGGKQ
jgi:hypothetical protein